MASAEWCTAVVPVPGRSRASVRIFCACAGLIAAAVVPHSSRAACWTSVASDAYCADDIDDMDDDIDDIAVVPCCPSPNSTCSTVCPTVSSVAIPASERSRPARGATTRTAPANPAPSVHHGTVAQEAIE